MKLPNVSATDLIGYFFAAAVTVSCVRHLAGGGLRQDFAIFKNRTLGDWIQVVVGDLIACTFLGTVAVFSDHYPKFLQFTWLNLIPSDSHQPAMNLMLSGARLPIFGLLFVPLLFLNLPRLAAAEEESFREGTRDWKHAVPRSLSFGLMHMVVGVPLWAGLALAGPGLWFTAQYFKGGVSRSTMAHSLYNMILATCLFAWVVSISFSK